MQMFKGYPQLFPFFSDAEATFVSVVVPKLVPTQMGSREVVY
jgi:hypothetical protein